MIIGAIILAAGSSSRLGEPKQLLLHKGGTLVEKAIAAALEAQCQPVVVVTGAVELPLRIAFSRVAIAHNPAWGLGMGGSIRCGVLKLLSIVPTLDRLLILVCDQTALNGGVLTNLLEHWEASRRPMAACAYADSIGPPCGFDRSRFDALLDLAPEWGAKSLLRDVEQISVLDWPQGAADIDTPEDLRRWRQN